MSIRQVFVSTAKSNGDKPGIQTYRQFTVNGSFGTPPLSAPCTDITISGFRTSGSIGSCSPGLFRGYIINQLDQETTYFDDGFGCSVDTATVVFRLTGFTGASSFIDKIVCVDNSNYTFLRTSATYSSGLWTWNDSIDLGFATGTIRVYYTP